MPDARELDNLPIATVKPAPLAPLEGYTFEGYRNADGSVGTRNILAVTTTVQCVAGVVDFAVRRIKAELLPRYPNVDDVVGLEHTYGCGVAIDAPGAEIPIRTLRNISLNPNFGGEVMVVSLGCEKLQPERLLPPGSIPITDLRNVTDTGANADPGFDLVCLQDEDHVGFMSMIDSIMTSARPRLERLHLRHPATGRGHEPACVHHRTRHAVRAGAGAGDQGGHAQRPGAALARPDGCQRRHHRRWLRLDRRGGLGAVPTDAGSGQRPQEDLGRTLETAQRPGAVQPCAGDLTSGRSSDIRVGGVSYAPGVEDVDVQGPDWQR